MKDVKSSNVLYAVLKMQESVVFTHPITQVEHSQKISGIAGFIPCFSTIEEAEDASCDGKYQILKFKTL